MTTVGIDLVDLEDLKKRLIEPLVDRILSLEEKTYYNKITSETRKLTYLGGRFAAKEAIFKALKQGDQTLNYKDITILNDEFGAPYVKLAKYSNYQFEISISHTDKQAVSIVLLNK